MREIILILVVLFTVQFHERLIAQEPESKVILVQGNDQYVLGYDDTTIILSPSKFRFDFELKNAEGIFVAATTKDEYYNTPLDSTWNNWEFTSEMVGTEEENNSDMDLMVGHESFKYWFYSPDSKDWHRFDKGPKIVNGIIYASYTIDKIFDLESGEYIELTKFKEPVYLLFFQSKFDDNKMAIFPVERKRLILTFQ